MTKEMRIALSTLASLALTAATFAMPVPATPPPNRVPLSHRRPRRSLSPAEIASVEKSSFTLAVGSGSTDPGQQMRQTSPKTMSFMIDKNTTVDGKLKVGANADVTYREEGGNNIAVSVRVSQ